MKKLLIVLSVIVLGCTVVSADWLVEVKVEGELYEHNNALEMILLLETIEGELKKYENIDSYVWKNDTNLKDAYNIERWDQLQDLVVSLLYREDYNFVGIYTKDHPMGSILIPFIYTEKRFTPPDMLGTPENFPQRNFDLKTNESLLTKSFNEGKGYFTTNVRKIAEKAVDKDKAKEYQEKAGIRGYFSYPIKNGEITIGLLVIATMEPGITEEQYFRIEQYCDAASWLVVQTVDLMVNPEKLGL